MSSRRFSSRKPTNFLVTLVVAVLILIWGLGREILFPPQKSSRTKNKTSHSQKQVDSSSNTNSQSHEKADVVRVVDGDTVVILLNGQEEKVRLIGVDTPESKNNEKARRDSSKTGESVSEIVKLGKEAAQYTKSILPKGTKVTVETDVQPRDRYGRLLAYLYLENGEMVNSLIIQNGYAQVMTIPPNVKYEDLFRKLMKEARENNRGLWKE